jgi:hypothetical protein
MTTELKRSPECRRTFCMRRNSGTFKCPLRARSIAVTRRNCRQACMGSDCSFSAGPLTIRRCLCTYPPDAVATGQPRTNSLIPILQRKPRDRDCKWQDQAYPAQDHEFAWVAAMNKVRNDIHERDVSDVNGVRELAAELAKPHHAGPRFRVCSGENDERKQ